MYTSRVGIMPQRLPAHPAPDSGDLHFGIKLYKNDEVFSVDIDDTRFMWNILVFKSRIYAPEMGYKDFGAYVSPILDLQDSISLGDHFKGFLLSIPIETWPIFDNYDMERHFTSYHYKPFVELDRTEAYSLCRMMSLMKYPLAEGADPYNDMELMHLCRAFLATLNRHYESQEHYLVHNTTGSPHVDRFLHLIETHCPMEKNLDFYARQLGITTKHLSHIVVTKTGKCARAWIAEKVIEEAKSILVTTPLPINVVAKKIGFISSSEFCRFFRSHVGISPLQYRVQNISYKDVDGV